jgi:beta-lactamase superfamily II metal-dependent hydrolase
VGRLLDLSVGCASCAILSSGTSHLIVDCSGIEAYERELPESGRIDALIVTHQHYDHFDGLAFLYDRGYSIGRLAYSPYLPRGDEDSVAPEEWKRFEELKELFRLRGAELDAPYGRTGLDRPYMEAGDMRVFILGPDETLARAPGRTIHDACLVVLVELNGRRILFTGDASSASLETLARAAPDLRAEFLHASHHGGAEGAVEAFVRAVSPRTTVVSTASGVYPELPSGEALALYDHLTRGRVYRTDLDGTCDFEL